MRLAHLALALAVSAGHASAATFLFLDSTDGNDWVGQGLIYSRTPADGVFSVTRNFDNGISINFQGSPESNYWQLEFVGPMETAPAVGAYEGAFRYPFQGSVAPGLSVSGEHRGCNELTGRFDVLEVTYGGGGEVLSFAADFEQHCDPPAPALFGSIRWNAGDVGCQGQPDGIACEDHDGCTSVSTCQGEVCVGTNDVACDVSGNPCVAGGLCDPRDAACVGGQNVADGTACDDGVPCTTGATCQSGICTASGDATCDDADPCTDDACGASGECVHTAHPCWRIGGTTVAAALRHVGLPKVQGFTAFLVFPETGSYRVAVQDTNASCLRPDGESGTQMVGRRGRIDLQPGALDGLAAAASACLAHPFTIASYATRLKITPDQTQLKGTTKVTGALDVTGHQLRVRAVSRFTGSKLGTTP